MPDIKGFQSLQRTLKSKQHAAAQQTCTYVVGYTAYYALYVHEKVEMKWAGLPRSNGRGNFWDPQGRAQAKFLEAPARRLKKTFAQIVRENVKDGMPLDQALLLVALRLQRESMMLVPVDTGNLRASAFTEKEQ